MQGQKPVTSSSLAYLALWPTAGSYSSFGERLGAASIMRAEGSTEQAAQGLWESPWGDGSSSPLAQLFILCKQNGGNPFKDAAALAGR